MWNVKNQIVFYLCFLSFQLNAQSSSGVKTIESLYSPDIITNDGIMDEDIWSYSTDNEADWLSFGNQLTFYGYHDFDLRFRLTHHQHGISFFVYLNDDELKYSQSGLADNILLKFSVKNAKLTYTEDNPEINIRFTKKNEYAWTSGQYSQTGTYAKTVNGFQFEFTIPWKVLDIHWEKLSNEQSRVIGMQMEIYDVDQHDEVSVFLWNPALKISGSEGLESYGELVFEHPFSSDFQNVINNKTEISAFPNPVNDKLFFTRELKYIDVFNITGKRIGRIDHIYARFINISFLEKGVYLFQMHDTNGQISAQKIIKY